MASELQGPTTVRLLEPPGFLALHYGVQTPVSVVIAHLAFGLLLFLNLTGLGRQRSGPTLFVSDAQGYAESLAPAEDWHVPDEHEGDPA